MNYPEELIPQSNYKIIRIDAICNKEREVFGLSTNLYAVYVCNHLNFNPLDKSFHDYWSPGDSVLDATKIEYELIDDVFPIFFFIKDLHRQTIPYKKTMPNKNNIQEFHGTTSIVHKPTKCNYWHFEFSIHDVNDNIISKAGGTWQKNIANFLLKSFLKEYAFSETPSKQALEDDIYKN
ncbi:MAG: hypothetical protein PF693_16635 [Spirochaetia bacterium]|jgi:hypothetical protein|nr:hypothetical protein [Spirochaetia bacterium]